MNASLVPLSLDHVADRLERLLLRYEELQKANVLLQEQLQEVLQERDSLQSRLMAARTRVDSLLARLPQMQPTATAQTTVSFTALASTDAPLDAGVTSVSDEEIA